VSRDRERSKANFSKSLREGLWKVVSRVVARVGTLTMALILAAASHAHATGRVVLLLVAEDYSNLGRSEVGVKRGLEVADLLRLRGFEVVSNVNPTNASARATLGNFLEQVKGSEVAIVLLMGHGVSTSGQTFFLPKNAAIERSTDLLSQGLSISNLIRIASMSKSAAICFLMTAPSLPVGLDDVDVRPRLESDVPANVSVAFSTSNRIPVSRMDAMAKQAADSIITLLKDDPHASLRQFSSACTDNSQGAEVGEASELDLTKSTPVKVETPTPAGPISQNDEGRAAAKPTGETAVQPSLQSPPEPVAFDPAVKNAAAALFSQMPPSRPGDAPREIVIDPLVDARSGARNSATTKVGGIISDLVKDSFKGFTVAPFSRGELAKHPLTLIGALEAVNSLNIAEGSADAFWICLAMIDLQTGKIVSKANTRAWAAGVDTTPDVFFQDSPIRLRDEATTAYVRTCQVSRIGDTSISDYTGRIGVASVISDAIDAYDATRYSDAADLWRTALASPGGDQLRPYNGFYLANWRLNRVEDAKQSFANLIDRAIAASTGVVMFLFEPNSTVFDRSKVAVPPYEMWLKVIAARGAAQNACFQIVGHASRTGAVEANDRLSVQRAEYVRDRLIGLEPSLASRTVTTGVGSKEIMARSDADGPDNAVDRRVELKLVKCEQK
jgi:outer membrane protein OmpA-like peptidoglycan-associated protein